MSEIANQLQMFLTQNQPWGYITLLSVGYLLGFIVRFLVMELLGTNKIAKQQEKILTELREMNGYLSEIALNSEERPRKRCGCDNDHMFYYETE
ncbi:MAG: hypothetical protein EKK57_09790 [Proteobacteria bacterium]|nr:MAG: hypothetical protein EKK57_09790 [Pseudomonadota bacterium]